MRVEQRARAEVNFARQHDVLAGFHALEKRIRRGLARGVGDRRGAAFERGVRLFKRAPIRIAGASVDVIARHGIVFVARERGRHHERRRHGACERIRLARGVDGAGLDVHGGIVDSG